MPILQPVKKESSSVNSLLPSSHLRQMIATKAPSIELAASWALQGDDRFAVLGCLDHPHYRRVP